MESMNLKRFIPGPWTLLYIITFLVALTVIVVFCCLYKYPYIQRSNPYPYKVYP